MAKASLSAVCPWRSGAKAVPIRVQRSQASYANAKDVLHDQPLTLSDHHLVNLRHEFSEARLDPDGDTFHGIVRYRAVTEPDQAVAA